MKTKFLLLVTVLAVVTQFLSFIQCNAQYAAPTHFPVMPCTPNYVCTGTNAEVDLMKKYWNYRDRFRKYFSKLGTAGGDGLQVSSIEFSAGRSSHDACAM